VIQGIIGTLHQRAPHGGERALAVAARIENARMQAQHLGLCGICAKRRSKMPARFIRPACFKRPRGSKDCLHGSRRESVQSMWRGESAYLRIFERHG